jgi:hypothetical protein
VKKKQAREKIHTAYGNNKSSSNNNMPCTYMKAHRGSILREGIFLSLLKDEKGERSHNDGAPHELSS